MHHQHLIAALRSAFIHSQTRTSSISSFHCPSFQSPFSTACQEFARPSFTPSALFFACTHPLISRLQPSSPRFFFLRWHWAYPGPSNFCLCTLNIRSMFILCIQLPCLILEHTTLTFCLTEPRLNLQPHPLNLHTALLQTTPSRVFLEPLAAALVSPFISLHRVTLLLPNFFGLRWLGETLQYLPFPFFFF